MTIYIWFEIDNKQWFDNSDEQWFPWAIPPTISWTFVTKDNIYYFETK